MRSSLSCRRRRADRNIESGTRKSSRSSAEGSTGRIRSLGDSNTWIAVRLTSFSYKTRECGAAIPVVPVDDTIKETSGGTVIRTLERQGLQRVQTPQGFAREVLERALQKAREDGFYGTDEAALVERTGHPVAAVAGDPRNIKITSPADLKAAEAYLED
jgi:2-C-methyl-D-erythritol 4-phosphate cytidylyltransferase